MKKILLVLFLVLTVAVLSYLKQKGGENKVVDNGGMTNFIDDKGKLVETQSLLGTVKSWDWESGTLVVDTGGSQKSFKLNPPETMILVPEAQAKGVRVLMIKSREDKHWSTAFCAGDTVTLGVEGNRVVGVDNGGYRMCGLKE